MRLLLSLICLLFLTLCECQLPLRLLILAQLCGTLSCLIQLWNTLTLLQRNLLSFLNLLTLLVWCQYLRSSSFTSVLRCRLRVIGTVGRTLAVLQRFLVRGGWLGIRYFCFYDGVVSLGLPVTLSRRRRSRRLGAILCFRSRRISIAFRNWCGIRLILCLALYARLRRRLRRCRGLIAAILGLGPRNFVLSFLKHCCLLPLSLIIRWVLVNGSLITRFLLTISLLHWFLFLLGFSLLIIQILSLGLLWLIFLLKFYAFLAITAVVRLVVVVHDLFWLDADTMEVVPFFANIAANHISFIRRATDAIDLLLLFLLWINFHRTLFAILVFLLIFLYINRWCFFFTLSIWLRSTIFLDFWLAFLFRLFNLNIGFAIVVLWSLL